MIYRDGVEMLNGILDGIKFSSVRSRLKREKKREERTGAEKSSDGKGHLLP